MERIEKHLTPQFKVLPLRSTSGVSKLESPRFVKGSTSSPEHEITGPRAHEPWGESSAHLSGRKSISHASCMPYQLPVGTVNCTIRSKFLCDQSWQVMHSSISPVQSISVSPCGRKASRITMPFVDLNTFDEHFATLRLLSPFSRTISEQAGFANHTPPLFAFVIYFTCIRGRLGQNPESNLIPALTRPVPPDALWRFGRPPSPPR